MLAYFRDHPNHLILSISDVSLKRRKSANNEKKVANNQFNTRLWSTYEVGISKIITRSPILILFKLGEKWIKN